jgi:hypothetical protein
MDPLRRDDVEQARRAPPEERAKQAFEAMRAGIRLKRASIRSRNPGATEQEIEETLRLWLERKDP